MNQFITALLDQYANKPILCIGGGPSAPAQLAWLRDTVKLEPGCILSANAHGFKQDIYKPDYIVCVDNKHSETRESMEELLRPYDTPIIGRFWWCDYRTSNLNVFLNSGQMSMLIALLLGGRPAIGVGMDCWIGKTYFHNPDVKVACSGRPIGYVTNQLNKLKKSAAGLPIRPVSGPMTPLFSRYDAHEEFGQFISHPRVKELRDRALWKATCVKGLNYELANVPVGAEYVVDEKEYQNMQSNQYLKRCTFEQLKAAGCKT